jgi:polyferredoxin
MESTNYSIVGKEAQSLSIFKKVGVFLFAIGILALVELMRMSIYDAKATKEVFDWSFFGLVDFEWTLFEWVIIGSFTLQLIGAFIFTYEHHHFSISSIFSMHTNRVQKLGLFLGAAGFSIFIFAWLEIITSNYTLFLWLSMSLMAAGILLNTYGLYGGHTKGIKNNHVWFNTLSSRGLLGWVSGLVLTTFYIQLYWFPGTMEGLIRLFDPLSYLITGGKASNWFLYGTVYTFLILFLGIKFIYKYRHNRYQVIRTISVIFFQVVFAYSLPHILEAFNDYQGYFGKDLKNVWPLNYYATEGYQLDAMANPANNGADVVGVSGSFYFFWSIILFLVVTPVLTYYAGKRWYCSWVCGCGGLAETAGDSFRQLSSKTRTSWQIERWVIHSVMVFVLAMTIASLWPYFTGKDYIIGGIAITSQVFYYSIMGLLLLSALGGGLLFWKRKHPFLAVGTLILLTLALFLSYAYNNFIETGEANQVFVFTKYVAVIVVFAAAIIAGISLWKRDKQVISIGIFILLLIGAYYTYAHLAGVKEPISLSSKSIKKVYGFLVGSAFAGVIGVGFYPLLGNRVWCRFGCPMAGYMGIIQRFKSKFRITTNGAQCISCGNCSTYCEQGIDVRAYAQKGENIVRASCVGCGVCSAVCPRGVLKLENGPEEGRFDSNPLVVSKDGVKLNS